MQGKQREEAIHPDSLERTAAPKALPKSLGSHPWKLSVGSSSRVISVELQHPVPISIEVLL